MPINQATFTIAELDGFAGDYNAAYGGSLSGADIGAYLNDAGAGEWRGLVRALEADPFSPGSVTDPGDFFSSSDLSSMDSAMLAYWGENYSGGSSGYVNKPDSWSSFLRKILRAILEAIEAGG